MLVKFLNISLYFSINFRGLSSRIHAMPSPAIVWERGSSLAVPCAIAVEKSCSVPAEQDGFNIQETR